MLIGLASIHAAWGAPTKMKKISQAHSYILGMQKYYGAEAVLVISDVDGTLTSRSLPNDNLDAPPAVPRGSAVQMIQDVQRNGSPVIVSSAWNNFNGTTKRLRELNLDKTIQIPPVKTFEHNAGMLTVNGTKIPVEYSKAGNAISVRVQREGQPNYGYYMDKALAPYLDPDLKKKIESGKIKIVIFLDDSRDNHKVFAKDVAEYTLYPDASIEYIHLGPPSEDPAENHQPSHSTASAATCSSLEASSPISNLTETIDDDAKVVQKIYYFPNSFLKPSEITQEEITQTPSSSSHKQ